MKKRLRLLIAGAALAATMLVSGSALAFQAKDAPKAAKAPATAGPSDKDIADASSKGLVWVNTNTKVYHKDGQFYGKTKQGKFMAEPDAVKAGYRAAKASAVTKKKAAVVTKK